MLLLFLASCRKSDFPNTAEHAEPKDSLQWQAASILGNGKWKNTFFQQDTYMEVAPQSLDFPMVDAALIAALENNLKLIERLYQGENRSTDNTLISSQDLQDLSQLLLRRQYQPGSLLANALEVYRLKGSDNLGHVRFTGYYLPLMEIDHQQSPEYPWPIYRKPDDSEDRLLDREAIVSGQSLAGKNLEIAWAKDKTDIYYAQLQGSAIGSFPDGSLRTLAWDGSNQHPYRSIEKFLKNHPEWKADNLGQKGIRKFLADNPDRTDSLLNQNPSYTFFRLQTSVPPGAGTVPLTPLVSVAADPDYFPLGTIMLAAVPAYDPTSKQVNGHTFQWLIAQDIGGLIKGAGRIDLFQGIGKEANRRANRINHYGKVWILRPRKIN
jgi:membrane-bound lytic murein transglycosylase A